MAYRYKNAVIADVARVVIDSSEEKVVDTTIIGEPFTKSRFNYGRERTAFFYDIDVINIVEVLKAFRECSFEVAKLTQVFYQGRVYSKKSNSQKSFEEILIEVKEGGMATAMIEDKVTAQIAKYLYSSENDIATNEPRKPVLMMPCQYTIYGDLGMAPKKSIFTTPCRYAIYGNLQLIQQEGLEETVFKTYEGYVCMTDEQKKAFEFIKQGDAVTIVEKTVLKTFNMLKERGEYFPKSCFVTKVDGGINIDRIEQYWEVYCPLGGSIKIDEEGV